MEDKAIASKLVNATKYDPTKQSQSRTISSLNAEIEKGGITLPIYQRDLSWTLQKAVALFNYQLYGKAPVSPLSLNKISLDSDFQVTQLKPITREIVEAKSLKEGQLSIIDGQQRLTTNYKAYIDHEDFHKIVLDIKKGKFLVIEREPNTHQIPIGKLLNKSQDVMTDYALNVMGLKELKDFSRILTVLLSIRTKIFQYSYTLHIANEMNEQEQIEWFEVLNNAGSKVSALQMTFAKLGSNEGFDIYFKYQEPFKKLIRDFDLNGLFSPYTTNVSYPIALLNPELELHEFGPHQHKTNYCPIPSDTKEAILAKLKTSELEPIIEKSLISLEKTLSFFKRQKLESLITRMDYILYVAGYISFNGLDAGKEQKLIEWVKKVNFSNLDNSKRRALYTSLIKNNF